jgi:cytochrome c2
MLLLCASVIAAGFGGAEWSRRRTIAHEAARFTSGDPTRGREHIARYGCNACHVIPGFPGTNSHVGPPLDQFALRSYVAGVAENTPDELEHFIRDPRAIAPKSAMPKLGVSEGDARDLAAFLYTLR